MRFDARKRTRRTLKAKIRGRRNEETYLANLPAGAPVDRLERYAWVAETARPMERLA